MSSSGGRSAAHHAVAQRRADPPRIELVITSIATRSARIAYFPRERYPCYSVEPVGNTTRPSRRRYSSICIELASNTRTINLTALRPTGRGARIITPRPL